MQILAIKELVRGTGTVTHEIEARSNPYRCDKEKRCSAEYELLVALHRRDWEAAADGIGEFVEECDKPAEQIAVADGITLYGNEDDADRQRCCQQYKKNHQQVKHADGQPEEIHVYIFAERFSGENV